MLVLNLSPFPTLDTERLTLRKISIQDAEDIYSLRSDDRVNKFLDRAKANSIEDAKNFIDQLRSRGSNNELLYWAITQKRDSKLIGTIMFWNISKEDHTAEIGFELHPDYQGRGLMREAVDKVVAFGLHDLKFKAIEAYPEAANEKSIQLLQKARFVQQDHNGEEKAGHPRMLKFVITGSN